MFDARSSRIITEAIDGVMGPFETFSNKIEIEIAITTNLRSHRLRRRNHKTKIFENKTMFKLSTLAFQIVFPRPLCALALALFCFIHGSTTTAFAPSPNQWAFAAKGDYCSKPQNNLIPSCRKEKTELLAHPILQMATQASSMASYKLLLMKDVSGPLSSLLTADPDVEAQFLMDVSHIFLDFTAFFKFDGQFLNYAQLVGRISFILIDFLPGHAFRPEEMAIQLFFLGINIQKTWTDSEYIPQEESLSSTDIDAHEIELQQQAQDVPLLMEESIHIRDGEQSLCDKEAKETTLDEWEQVELEKDNESR